MNDPRNWRDARLKKALESAPDEAARPADAVREAILNQARATAAHPKPRKPARRWFDLAAPWNSALASLFLIGFVTVLWTTQKPPPETLQVQAPARAQRPASVPAPSPDSSPAATKPEAAAKPPPLQTINVPRVPKLLPPVRVAESPVALAVAPPPLPPPVAVPRAALPAAPAPAPGAAVSRLAAAAPASAAGSAPQYVSVMGSRARARAETAWTELLVLEPAGSARWTPNQLPGEIVAQIQSMLDATPPDDASQDAKPEPPQMRLQVKHGEQLLGYLELGPTTARWISIDGRAVLTRPQGLAELIEALRSR